MATEVREQALEVPEYAPDAAVAADFCVRVNGRAVPALDTEVGAVAGFAFAGKAEVEITTADAFSAVKIRPLSRGIQSEISGRTIRFTLDRPAKLSIEFDDQIRRPLFLFADAIRAVAEQPQGEVIRFAAGQIHDAGVITLQSGQTLYLERGAIVRGAVYAEDATNVRITGGGILDGSLMKKHERRFVLPMRCQGVLIEDITLIGSPSWTICPFGCDDVTIRNVKIVNWRDSDDGIDVVGTQHVLIEDCFIRTKDDCIAIKATAYQQMHAGLRDVKDVTVRDSVFWNAQWGNALEIGFETRCDAISDITFMNCDVIRCEREGYYSGGVLTIHNGDRAIVSNVRCENIRIEDAREKLIDFKVQHSHYSKDEQRGQIRDIHLKDIQIVDGALPPSIIQSFDREHRVENITIENLTFRGQKITTPLEARAIIERAVNVKFI